MIQSGLNDYILLPHLSILNSYWTSLVFLLLAILFIQIFIVKVNSAIGKSEDFRHKIICLFYRLFFQLLGHIDMDTREWSDGVLTNAARQVVREPLNVHSWIICDGDIDPEWIESLNSVLDDNRLLTMPSGERIQFGPNVNFLFETHDLSSASPATISRMGMIFLR